MADFPLLLQSKGGLVGAAALELLKAGGALGVHQIKVKIADAAGLQLAFKEGADIRLTVEIAGGELVGQRIALPGVAAREAALERLLAVAVQIAVGGVKVVETGVQKGVDHRAEFRIGALGSVAGQAHAAETEMAVYFIKRNVHKSSSFRVVYTTIVHEVCASGKIVIH